MARYIEVKESKYELKINDDENVTIVIFSNELSLNYEIENSHAKLLIFNNAKDLVLNETGTVNNSEIEIDYIELNGSNLKQNSCYSVSENSSVNINTTYLGVANKAISLTLENKGRNSHTFVRNNVVALKDADFMMDIIGHIYSESRSSSAHQKSNCLTVEQPKKAKISPILLIDNNDVEASHSLASGTLDQEIMFYINSRGLSKDDALKLLLHSYLLKDDEFYAEFANGESIKQMSIGKVEEYVRR